MKRFLAIIAVCAAVAFGQAAQSTELGSSSTTTVGIHVPFFVGGALGFGSGTGVGKERGLGLRQIEPMIGLWYPGLGLLRAGYGFFDYSEKPDDGKETDIEHSDFDIEIGVHLLGQLYLMGGYSRSKELSDLGDVAWNEWAIGCGSILSLFGKAMLFAEITYRWVSDHYDPFLNESVEGTRLQFNIGFATYLY
jgi:hypothetical protein